jgi:hypothetical protein
MRSDQPSLLHRTAFFGSAAIVIFAVAACGSSVAPSTANGQPSRTSTAASTSGPAVTPQATASTASAPADASATPFADIPFAFPADSVVGFYEGEGMSCAAPVPSTKAAGWTVITCQGADAAGRPIAIGVVTDPAGRLGNGFASVTALPGADLLEPTDALDMLSGFLGAMLGDAAATDLLPWLAGHLGDTYAATMFGGGTIATYTESADDPTRIYIEVAGPAYMAAPTP